MRLFFYVFYCKIMLNYEHQFENRGTIMPDQQNVKVTYEGVIQDIIYYNEENGYVIAVMDVVDDLLSIKGCIPFIREEIGRAHV